MKNVDVTTQLRYRHSEDVLNAGILFILLHHMSWLELKSCMHGALDLEIEKSNSLGCVAITAIAQVQIPSLKISSYC